MKEQSIERVQTEITKDIKKDTVLGNEKTRFQTTASKANTQIKKIKGHLVTIEHRGVSDTMMEFSGSIANPSVGANQ